MGLTRAAVGELDPAQYTPHSLHGEQRIWVESNCYVDLWIEVLHWLGLEPTSCFAFALEADFEGDQWTFFKPPLADLRFLYGIDVQELNVWRPLGDHFREQLSLGRLVVAEADAYYLPDTAGTTYRTEHGKTSIAVQTIDLNARRLGYFHAAGYCQLEGDDFDGLFHLRCPSPREDFLPPYVELVKLDRLQRPPADELFERCVELVRSHLATIPASNPFVRYQERVDRDLAWLTSGGLEGFHRYAFATLRQVGASFELASLFLKWLSDQGLQEVDAAVSDMRSIGETSKTLQARVARVAAGRRASEVGPLLASMAAAWDRATRQLRQRVDWDDALARHRSRSG